jgi:hypothetical protein
MILGKFLNAVAVHYNRYHSDPSKAMEFLETALAVAKLNGEANEECTALASIAQIKLDTGAYQTAQIYAHKAQKFAELSGNLYQGVRALFVRAVCSMYFGNYLVSSNSRGLKRFWVFVACLEVILIMRSQPSRQRFISGNLNMLKPEASTQKL